AEEGPDVLVAGLFQAAVLEVAVEAGLVDGADGAQAHRHGGELPEGWHEPRVRVRGQPATLGQLAAEVEQGLLGEAALAEGGGVEAGEEGGGEVGGAGVALEKGGAGPAGGVGAVEEVLEADLVEGGAGGEGANVPADGLVVLVGLDDHGHGVPPHQPLDVALE